MDDSSMREDTNVCLSARRGPKRIRRQPLREVSWSGASFAGTELTLKVLLALRGTLAEGRPWLSVISERITHARRIVSVRFEQQL
jgi:hypothetical protein